MNGSFEINTAGVDQINLSNPAFNGFMSNTIAFGSFGDMDIIRSATYCGLPQNGTWYTALTGSGTDAITMQLAAPLVTGTTYTITFWDKGCWGTYSTSAPPVQIGLSTVAGALGTAVYTAPAPTNNVWVQRTATFVAPNNGQYISVVLTAGGLGDWTQIDNFAFSAAASPTANFTASNTNICPNNCINFTDMSTGAPTSWSWTFAGGIPATSTAQNPTNICYSTPGTYAVTLTATNANGSNTMNQTTYITVNPFPTVTAASSGTITCANPSVTLTGTSAGNTMVWNGGALVNAPNPATVSAAGTYTCTATSPAGCTATQTITVTSNTTPPVVTAASSGTITCTNTSVTLTGTSAGNTMVWNGGALVNAPNPATVSAAGTYTVTATDATNGCTATQTIAVSSNTTPPTVIATTSGNLSCTVLSVTLTGTSAGNTMVWNGGALVNAANPATVSAAGSYTVTATDATNGCTATQTVTVTSSATPPAVTATASGNITCTTTSITLTGTSAGNTMVWNGGALVNAPNPATVSATGTYTCTATDPVTGCTNTTTVTVTANTTPPVVTATGGTLTCFTTSVVLTGTSAGNTMVWNGGALVNAPNPATVSATGTYTVTATDPANGCTATQTVTVTSNTTPPTVTATSSGNISCTNPTSTLTGTSAGSTMVWNGGALSNASNPATVNAAGTYTVTAVDIANGCSSTATITITANITPPSVTIAPADTITCAVTTVALSATGSAGVTYSWAGPGIQSGGNSATPIVSAGGNYTCTVTNPVNGCTATQIVNVVASVNPPVATAGGGATINYGNSTLLTGTGGGTYAWLPHAGLSCYSCPNPTASPTVTTTYCVNVTDSLGCSDSACTIVVVDITCGTFGFPNAFSPNNDGENDVFHCMINPGCISDYHLVIYDRWGEKVFETEDYTQGWDGTVKGELLDNAVFVYYATATLSTTKEKLVRKGNVSLIR
ncbi:MAG: gliding motility-associated C-terminal domain-containing protein [Bacteroidetes bacterium]|nr:gliding motility-associated C-terminal domain-containing protein [Bacteroidota bacterium]